jgi:hypothetical protein
MARKRRSLQRAILSAADEKQRIEELERTYLLLFRERRRVLDKASPEEREQFLERYAAARVALTSAVADGMANNDPVVEQFYRDLVATNNLIEAELERLKDIAALIKLITEAVKLMAAIAALGA